MTTDKPAWTKISIDTLLSLIATEKCLFVSIFSHLGDSIETTCLCRVIAIRIENASFLLVHTYLFEDEFGGDIFDTIILMSETDILEHYERDTINTFTVKWADSTISLKDVVLLDIARDGQFCPLSSSSMAVIKSYSHGVVYECLYEMFFTSGVEVWKIALKSNSPDSLVFSRVEFSMPTNA